VAINIHLSFGNDRFIIITDITYFPMNVIPEAKTLTTIRKLQFMANAATIILFFAITIISNGTHLDFTAPVTINTFILHDQQVGFSFCNAPFFKMLS
jgi:hypothetical protein